jgi:hypothetical protein
MFHTACLDIFFSSFLICHAFLVSHRRSASLISLADALASHESSLTLPASAEFFNVPFQHRTRRLSQSSLHPAMILVILRSLLWYFFLAFI